MSNKYDASGAVEGQFESGSNNLVLANKLGITSVDQIENIEFDALFELHEKVFDELDFDTQISAKDLCSWHKRWLGDLYEWAGNYRSVNMSKSDFHFAVAHLVPTLMDKFNDDILSKVTPCNTMDEPSLIQALAQAHVEFILIHPFRDGNGRLGRLLMTIMALQAGYTVLDFTYIEDHKEDYILAIHAGVSMDYKPMEALISMVLSSSRD